ncbi:hypothetical protein J2S89_000117 [Arthrobacter bambusae]|nr:hypothetical protein [Arthrobacter bambusae]MDQ0096897.1 hypothetical protein [Arthrobacter bambusae]
MPLSAATDPPQALCGGSVHIAPDRPAAAGPDVLVSWICHLGTEPPARMLLRVPPGFDSLVVLLRRWTALSTRRRGTSAKMSLCFHCKPLCQPARNWQVWAINRAPKTRTKRRALHRGFGGALHGV